MAAEDAGVKVGEHIYAYWQNGWHLFAGNTGAGEVEAQIAAPWWTLHRSPAEMADFAQQQQLAWYQIVHLDTVLYSWLIMALLLVVGALCARGLTRMPGSGQTVVEAIVEFAQNTVRSFIGPEVAPYLWYIGSLFLFILTANWLGVLPWRLFASWRLPVYEAPTGDINTTAAFAILSFLSFYFFGFVHKGLGYLKHFVTPQWWLFPFLVIEDLSRPLSLSLRLFANVTAGHVVIAVLLLLVPVLLPLPLMGLEIFVGAIQAFIFAALSSAYIGAAISHDH
ncbi:MAG: F0F1 ATP synthase subunit A [Cyanobacteria bacterium NC_groundwater_1444_Ag_S-0.65um_54_12]|nr:F0F1 ATP synthase subunit A [Cyanobacteria bacterium NC_groundwater_1444_Ag_S-0.65um_54_12]